MDGYGFVGWESGGVVGVCTVLVCDLDGELDSVASRNWSEDSAFCGEVGVGGACSVWERKILLFGVDV